MNVRAGIPQGSILSPILFLLFAADLARVCEDEDEGTVSIAFADDINIVAYSQSTKRNCMILERVHEKALKWGKNTELNSPHINTS